MSGVSLVASEVDEAVLLRLARELAVGIHDLEQILYRLSITPEQYETLSKLPRFQQIAAQELSEWTSNLNTSERVKLKSAAMIEETLPEMYRVMHDPKEPLSGRVELMKLVSKLGAVDTSKAEIAGGGGFKLEINIGHGEPVRVTSAVKPVTIEHEG